MRKMRTLTVNGQLYTIEDPDSVSYGEVQSLTDEQKATARANIGAAAKGDGTTIEVSTQEYVGTDLRRGTQININTKEVEDGLATMNMQKVVVYDGSDGDTISSAEVTMLDADSAPTAELAAVTPLPNEKRKILKLGIPKVDILSADLTDEQKAQARENIGAADADYFSIRKSGNFLDVTTMQSGMLHTNGKIFTGGSYDAFCYFENYIPVNPGERISVQWDEGGTRRWSEDGTKVVFQRIAAYDASKNVLPDLGAQVTTDNPPYYYDVPETVAYIRFTVYASFVNTSTDIDVVKNAAGIIPHQEYGAASGKLKPECYDEEYLGEFVAAQTEKNQNKSVASGIFTERRESLASGEEISFGYNNVKNNTVFAFSANFSTFDKLKIGEHRSGNTWGANIVIDNTNVTLTSDVGDVKTVAHGLTLANNIQVKIANGNTLNLTALVIQSNGNTFTLPNLNNYRWNADNGTTKFVSDGSAFTDVSASWTSTNILKDIWMFGDSYFTLYSNRWIYYLIQDGYDKNCLISGYAGEASEAAMRGLETLLTAATPKYILWCLGMNDADNGAVNARWKTAYDKLIAYCEEKGITPILATIPNVPTVDNSYKNAIVKASGYQYIDFASAVSADSSATWYDGMNGDGVHPSVTGAKTLYMKALADFPQLAVSK